jgi:hypothetical protein
MIVELALILPLLLAILLGMTGVFYLNVAQDRAQNGIDVLVELAADGTEDWRSAVPSENTRTGCDAAPLEPVMSYPDGAAEPGKRILGVWSCHFRFLPPFDNVPLTVSSEAVLTPSAAP